MSILSFFTLAFFLSLATLLSEIALRGNTVLPKRFGETCGDVLGEGVADLTAMSIFAAVTTSGSIWTAGEEETGLTASKGSTCDADEGDGKEAEDS